MKVLRRFWRSFWTVEAEGDGPRIMEVVNVQPSGQLEIEEGEVGSVAFVFIMPAAAAKV